MNDEIETWIDEHEEELIDFLVEYIGYRSPTGDERAVQRTHVEPFFRDEMAWDDVSIVDVSPDSDRPNVNGYLAGSGEGPALLFNGHSDVVDVSDEAERRWTTDPWDAVVDDGLVYGRGANDMKGPNTAMIWAIKAVMESDVELRGDLTLSIVVGEELNEQQYGSIPATNALLEMGLEDPFCINGEPTSNEVHVESAGTFDFRIEIPGKEIHTSQKNLTRYPQRRGLPQGSAVGVDASIHLTEVLEKLRKLEHQWNMRYDAGVYGGGGTPVPTDRQGLGPIGINCSIIRAGEYVASLPGSATIEGHVFYPPGADVDRLWGEINDAVESVATTSDWLRDHPIETSWKEHVDWPPFETPRDHPACRTLGNAITSVTGSEPIYSGFKAVCDNAYVQRECGVDAVSFGPGNVLMGAHGPDERVPIDQLLEATKVYASTIVDYCG
ncbi:M20 family metallopeptidase [Natrarchaeobius oligotrophus]|uniref:M20 family metallopeptidase n=1 Tax=Natrarchaeobius oligotrophus TaxID=3455743 RepID=UPI001FB4B4C1|nr:M20/M25/M40 family metallo-hydrolase [Natrarchaeobius chitinivorans]